MSECFNLVKNEHDFFVQDRVFWVYCLVSLFFTILGIVFLSYNNKGTYLIFPWTVGNICLLYCVYMLSLSYIPFQICTARVLDNPCLIKSSWKWISVNVIYLAILIISLLWCVDYGNPQAGIFRSISVVLVLIGGLALLAFYRDVEKYYNYVSPFFWTLVGFLLVWLVLGYCTVLITPV